MGTSSPASNRATLVATVTTLPDGGLASLGASALAVAGAESPLAGLIGAANTLVWNQDVWEA
ncbi:MAG TPA: hypothetical protein VLX28_10985, partial [Thermoanaerobaculia bacterium]|nr:hypothetical protein [Thermoanaerobaculia bacterium]